MTDWLPGRAQRQDWQLEIGQVSETGRVRQHNEDYVECVVPQDTEQLDSKGAIFVVADGMGGHQAGEVASLEATKRVIGAYYADTTGNVGESLVAAFKQANKDVFGLAQADSTKAGMGTTLVAAVLLGSKVTIANVGDSRAYLLRRKRLRQITMDHSWVEAQVQAGILTREQADIHPQRNLITRALGTKPSVTVDLFDVDLRRGDTFLLCTDGLSGQVGDQDLAQSIRMMPPQQAATSLVEQANAEGGRDNATVVIVQVGARREAVGLQQLVDAPMRWTPRQRLIAGLVVLILACLCAMVVSFPIANQRFVGNPAAAPDVAPIRFVDLGPGDLGSLADYLNYSTLDDMEAANPGQLDTGNFGMVTLLPASSGVFLVGQLQDSQCQGQACIYDLEMAGERYQVELDAALLSGTAPDLDGQRVRLYGLLPGVGHVVDARLLDLGEKWWVWWRPAWLTVYQEPDLEDKVWVYSIADQNPYSTINMADYPGLVQGDRILTKGRWLAGDSQDSMRFAADDAYRLDEGVYQSLSKNVLLPPGPTVTIRPTAGP